MGVATASAIAGRTIVGWVMHPQSDRRIVACASYAGQVAGSIAFITAAGTNTQLLLLGVVFFGAGIGNATSLPPLIAQAEFLENRVAQVVALTVAVSQAAYAFAPVTFGLVREFAPYAADPASAKAPGFFAAAAFVQGLAICALLLGRGPRQRAANLAAQAPAPLQPRPSASER